MAKSVMNLLVERVTPVEPDMVNIRLRTADGRQMPQCEAGQFVEVGIDGAGVLLNRPYSVFDCCGDCLELLVKPVGRASGVLTKAAAGTSVRVVGPLGRSFSLEAERPLLVGGGVGIAPVVFLAKRYAARGVRPTLIWGARTAPDSFIRDMLANIADLHICTDDGSAGFHGLVTQSPAFKPAEADIVQTCGPTPMMKAVGGACAACGTRCEVSLENKMACGLGACLCCVQDTTGGDRVCVCSQGPVFDYADIKW